MKSLMAPDDQSTRPRSDDEDVDEPPSALLPIGAGRNVGNADERSQEVEGI
jgi:hypothetical protein